MSTPIPPPDQTPLWRRLLAILLLAVWPVVGFILLLGSAAEESNLLGQGFATLVEAPWWVATGACMALVSATLFALPASLRVAVLFSVGVAIVDAGHTAQERRARRPPQGGNGA